ncbi:MAG: CBS domain-containing protein [Actinobacteria bacterium]|nr:MAG: CBS domain-containing protein [Actinomycetota bacterium]
MAKTARDIMDPDTPTVGPEAPVDEVVRIMAQGDEDVVLVINEGHRCIGIITDSDLVIGEEEGDIHIPHYVEIMGGVVFLEPLRKFEAKVRKAVASRARDLMTEDPVTVDADATAHEAARIVVERHHNHLPVVDHGRLVGLLTRADVLAALVEE